MLDRTMFFGVLYTLIVASAAAQESGDLYDPMTPGGRSSAEAAGTGSGPAYHLTGTLISPSGRVAIVNGRPSREGDRVDGADILSIEAGVVRMRTASEELTVFLGTQAPGGGSSDHGISREPPPPVARSEPGVAGSAPPSLTVAGSRTHGPVARGETLSGISQRYRSDGVTMNQMMIALYRANPRAFSGNINVLREGAVLRIPDGDELQSQPPSVATAEVARQEHDWRGTEPRQASAGIDPARGSYGPVARGESLSEISERVSRAGVTRHQMMIALYRANPHAFSGNINVLHEGAVLRMPDGDELQSQPPSVATAEVVRQTDVWRSGSWRQARLRATPASDRDQLVDVMPPAHGTLAAAQL